MNYLAICAVVKNEAPYIEEWLEFHLMQGVEHFYIYDNESTDGTSEILKRYERQGLVTDTPWPVNPPQFEAYNHCLKVYGYQNEWIAFIDVDEFLYIYDDEDIKQYLALLPDTASVLAVHWVMYGSSGAQKQENGLVTRRFFKKALQPNGHVKSIVRPAKTISVGNNPHTFRVREGDIINERNEKLPEEYAILENPTAIDIRINHYHTKSKEEYFERKLTKPDPGSGVTYNEERVREMFIAHDINDSYDLSASSKSIGLHKILERLRKCSL